MLTNCPTFLLFWALTTLCAASPSVVGEDAAREPIPLGTGSITVASQRTFSGEVDWRTDDTRLWLRWSHGTVAILRPIDWHRVVRGEFGERAYTADELRKAVARPAVPDPEAGAPEPGRGPVIRVHAGYQRDSDLARPGRPTRRSTAGSRRSAGRVRSLALDAMVSNWDADVEADGLVVHLRPLDAAGQVVPVRGTLQVTLIGWQWGRTNSRQAPFRLARWTRSVDPADLGPFGVEHRLPFQAVHPEFDLRWAPQGAVHARLAVPGEGVFDVTESTVRIRPYSAMRDHWEYVSGGRFFPVERTGRGRR